MVERARYSRFTEIKVCVLSCSRFPNNRCRLLEVGALKPDNYQSCQSWIDNTPIDLKSQHPDILEQDLLKLDQTENREKWDMISLSLVLNFTPNAEDRGKHCSKGAQHTVNKDFQGRMLLLTHTILKDEGLLFLAVRIRTYFSSAKLELSRSCPCPVSKTLDT